MNEITTNSEKVEHFLNKYLEIFFILLGFLTVYMGIRGRIIQHGYTMGDWLINYQGGFVRRGFLGELIYQMHQATGINPCDFVVVFQILLYAVFGIASYRLLKRQNHLLPYIFLIFSPNVLLYHINEPYGGFRKEIIYFALLSINALNVQIKTRGAFERVFFLTLALYPLAILSHEILFAFLPYLFALYFIRYTPDTKRIVWMAILLCVSVFSFLFALAYSGDSRIVLLITRSLKDVCSPFIARGAIAILSHDSSGYVQYLVKEIMNGAYPRYYGCILFLSLLAFLPIRNKIKLIFDKVPVSMLLLSSFCMTVVLAAVAVDWGRFLYIHLMSLLILTLVLDRENISFKIKSLPVFIGLVLLYSFSWNVSYVGTGDVFFMDTIPYRIFYKIMGLLNVST